MYTLIYDNPERNYLISLTYDTAEEAIKQWSSCIARGMQMEHFSLHATSSTLAQKAINGPNTLRPGDCLINDF